MTETVAYGRREVPVLYDVDVAVVGAGAAGTAAACAAAEEGAETVLVDRYGFLGGTSTAAGLATFCGFFSCAGEGQDPTKIVAGFGDDVLDGLAARGALDGPVPIRDRTNIYVYDPEELKLVYDDLVAASGAVPLLHSRVSEVLTEPVGERVRASALLVETSAGTRAITASQVVDATGDGFVTFAAGAAVDHQPERLQSGTTIFYVGGIDVERARDHSMREVRDRMRRAVERGEYDLPKTDGIYVVLPDKEKAWVNFTDVPMDATDPEELTAGEREGREQVREYLRFFRNELAGFEDASLHSLPTQVGIRETRKAVGEYVLDYEDFADGARFGDAVAHCGWARETHDPETRASDWEWPPGGGFYDVPYRSLVVRDAENLVAAGRCASATHEIQASMRVIGTAYATGEAAGVAAARCCAEGVAPREVEVDALRAALQRRGAFLPDR